MKFVILHGAYGSPNDNWFPWLKTELETLGHNVEVPTFPTPEGQSLKSWLNVFDGSSIDEETILIGHSLAPAFILNLLESHKARAAFFIAGFLGKIDNPDFDGINSSFMKEFDWEKIRANCKRFYLYHSKDDPYVPLEKGSYIALMLKSDLKVFENAGHFNTKAGYDKFPELLEDIKKELA